MYKIQKIFNDIDDNVYDSKNLNYGDIVYIFLNKGIDFNSLKKITMEEFIETNEHGIIIRGFETIFDDEGNEEKKYYTGIFVYKLEDRFILTKEGYKVPVFLNDKLELMPYDYILDKKIIDWQFKLDKFIIILNISGNLYFPYEEAKKFIKNIKFESCLAYSNKIVLNINDMKIIFDSDISVRYLNKEISYDNFFRYICENYKASNNAIYDINKYFNLQSNGFIISGY